MKKKLVLGVVLLAISGMFLGACQFLLRPADRVKNECDCPPAECLTETAPVATYQPCPDPAPTESCQPCPDAMPSAEPNMGGECGNLRHLPGNGIPLQSTEINLGDTSDWLVKDEIWEQMRYSIKPSELPGWNQVDSEYFKIRLLAPTDVTLSTKYNGIVVDFGGQMLVINMRRPDEPFSIQRTDIGAGDFQDSGELTILGESVKQTRLIYNQKVMGVYWNQAGEITLGGVVMTLQLDSAPGLESDAQYTGIPENIIVLAEEILSSMKPLPEPR